MDLEYIIDHERDASETYKYMKENRLNQMSVVLTVEKIPQGTIFHVIIEE